MLKSSNENQERSNIIKYERRHLVMSNNSLHQTQSTSNLQQMQTPTPLPPPIHESWFDKKTIISTIIATVSSAILLAIGGFIISTAQSPKIEIAEMKNDIKQISTSIEQMNINIVAMQSDINYLKNDVERLKDKTYASIEHNEATTKLTPTALLMDSLDASIIQTNVSMPTNLSALALNDTDIIAKDSAGKEYTVRELVNQKLLLPYENNEQEVYFYGQFNEQNQWQGECILNVYQDNELILITEATYNNGIVQSYKQALPTKKENNSWIVSDRQNRGDYNSGESRQYVRGEKEIIAKSFNVETVSNVDMLTIEQFTKLLPSKLEGYYYGNTSKGQYNDNTGTAYLIKYDKFGKIRTLYSGNFKDGKFNDHTGCAWYITRDVEEGSDYMYYKGNFQNGTPINKSESNFKNNLTLKELDSYTKGKVFHVDISWATEDSF